MVDDAVAGDSAVQRGAEAVMLESLGDELSVRDAVGQAPSGACVGMRSRVKSLDRLEDCRTDRRHRLDWFDSSRLSAVVGNWLGVSGACSNLWRPSMHALKHEPAEGATPAMSKAGRRPMSRPAGLAAPIELRPWRA